MGLDPNWLDRQAEKPAPHAAHADNRAARHENLMPDASPRLSPVHRQQAAANRGIQQKFLSTARLFRLQAAITPSQLRPSRPHPADCASLIAGVADLVHSRSVGIGIASRVGIDMTLSSDAIANAAQAQAALIGVGPLHSCLDEGPISAGMSDLERRWPLYARELRAVGVEQVLAIPLRVADRTFGYLAAFDSPDRPIRCSLLELEAVGEWSRDVLLSELDRGNTDGFDLIPTEGWSAIHQAMGILAAQFGCSPSDALALLRGRAFAESQSLESAAAEVIAGGVN